MKLKTLVSALVPALLLVNSSIADDLDIYLGKRDANGNSNRERSRVLFIVDESGSMHEATSTPWDVNDPFVDAYKSRPRQPYDGYQTGEYLSRFDALKQAFLGLLDPNPVTIGNETFQPLENMDIGLGIFEDISGEIIAPMVNVDAPGARQSLQDALWNRTPGGATPLVPALHEGLRYFRGMSSSQLTRGARAGTPDEYVSPGFASGQDCTQNTIILLTDGDPTSAASLQDTRSDPEFMTYLDGSLVCPAQEVVNDDDPTAIRFHQQANRHENCGVSLARFAGESDFDDATPGVQNIITHTISFGDGLSQAGMTLLDDIAKTTQEVDATGKIIGGGRFEQAQNAAELRRVLSSLFKNAAVKSGGFSAPSVPVDADNGLLSGSDIYLNLFQSEARQIWLGNVKRFKMADGELMGTTDGNNEIIATNPPTGGAVAGSFKDDVGDLFATTAGYDAARVDSGGVGSHIKDWRDRQIYAWDANGDTFLVDESNELAFNKADAWNPNPAGNAETVNGPLRTMLKNEHNHCRDGDDNAQALCLDRLVRFMMGEQTNPEFPAGPVAGNRWGIMEVMHGGVKTVTVGKDSLGKDRRILIFGTNDGALHVHDADTGEEKFTFYIPNGLANADRIENYSSSIDHIYGLDGEPSILFFDENNDGDLYDADDYLRIYVGERRGGRGLHAFELDVAENGDIKPEMIWTVDGAEAAGYTGDDQAYVRLGQTWGKPQLARMHVPGTDADSPATSQLVMVIGGGYDAPNEDIDFGVSDPNESHLGNAVYIINPENGDIIWWTSSDAFGGTDSNKHSEMKASIAADVTLVDTNYDQLIDRIFAVDTIGQVWRIDLSNAVDSSDFKHETSLFAQLSTDGKEAGFQKHERKFFYAPVWVRAEDVDMITIVSGNRPDPTSETVQDRAFNLFDINTAAVQNGGSVNTIQVGDMLDVTSILDPDDVKKAIENKRGWFFDLETSGEKGFSTPVIVDGQMTFTTYVPASASQAASVGECSVHVGSSYLYAVDIKTGAPAWDNPGIPNGERGVYLAEGPSGGQTAISTSTDGSKTVGGNPPFDGLSGSGPRYDSFIWQQL